MAESLREFLDRRERELLTELAPAESQVVAIRAELTEVRRAKAALTDIRKEIVEQTLANTNPLEPAYSALLNTSAVGALSDLSALSSLNTVSALVAPQEQRLSIKQMILAALDQNVDFRRRGATVGELRDWIKQQFGRDIEGTSLSPQLSRLREERFVESYANARWKRFDPREKS